MERERAKAVATQGQAAAAAGLFPRLSMSSHSSWEFSPFFSQMTVRVYGGSRRLLYSS